MKRRPLVLIIALAVLAIVVAVPVLAAKPSSPPGQAKDKPAKAPITLNGTIESATDADGKATYTLADGGTTYTLEAGPTWFFGDAYPLKPFVGKSVKVEGEIAEGSTDVDVISIDGTALREAGKPPWAGGWKQVGERHPGWSQEKADRMKAKFGDCFPPGQCKDKSGKDKAGADADADDDEAVPD
ncbi:MAG TPA: hypothetical protein VM451_05745 [Candidatus Limnocylindria bacterium]|nr:hypothetical protein [Candidatus Limnocylindria bacterium]